jgi:hypothetical protein
MRSQVFAFAAVLALASCESKKSTSDEPAPKVEKLEKKPAAPLTDITTATSFGAIRTEFNAHKGEARFLTLLSPT